MNPYVIPGLKDHDPIDFNKIADVVCEYYNIDKAALSGRWRPQNIVLARHITWYLLRKNSTMSLEQIGKMFNRDHTTVIYGVQMIRDYISTKNTNVINDINRILTKLRN